MISTTRTRTLSRRPWWSLALLIWFGVLGCQFEAPDDDPPDFSRLVPVKGTVTINGKPLPGLVVTFLPPKWSASNGETHADGSYTLQTASKPGALPGDYKVGISYLVSAAGEPQGLTARSSMSPTPGMATAKEKLPPEFSDFGRTTLKVTVPSGGKDFDFDVRADLETSPLSTQSKEEPSKVGR